MLTYGKTIPVGRVSDPPREVSDGLFLDAVSEPYRLQLVGVEQTSPAIPDAGYAYALAYALGIGETTIDEVLTELADTAISIGDMYHVLGGGMAGVVFSSARDLANAILDAFVRRDASLSPFGPGGAAASVWRAILAELARHAYGVETIVITDPDGTGSVTLETSPEAAVTISSGTEAKPAANPITLAILVSGPMGTYPLTILNPKFYLRTPSESRWMAARRTFTSGPPKTWTTPSTLSIM